MKNIDSPSVMEGRTPEQNIQSIKGWGNQLAQELTYQLLEFESQIETLREEIESLKEANNGV